MKKLSNAPNRPDELLRTASFDFGSQSADQNIDHVGLWVEMVVPYVLEDHGFEFNPAGISQQIFEQAKTRGCKSTCFPCPHHLASQ